MGGIEILGRYVVVRETLGKGLQSTIIDSHESRAACHFRTSRPNPREETQLPDQRTRLAEARRIRSRGFVSWCAPSGHSTHGTESTKFDLKVGRDMLPRMSPTFKRLLIALAMFGIVVALGDWARIRLGPQLDVDSVRSFAEGLGPAGPILFVFVVAGRGLLALPSQIVLIAAGLCFGTAIGTLVGGAGLMLSGLALFATARYAGRRAVDERVGSRGRRLLDLASHRSGAAIFALACGYPILPLSPIQAAAGLTPMSIAYFIPAAFTGGVIRASLFAYFGNALADASWVGAISAAGLFAVVLAIPLTFPTGRAWLREIFRPTPNEQAPSDT